MWHRASRLCVRQMMLSLSAMLLSLLSLGCLQS
jgi:hypothetical protein